MPLKNSSPCKMSADLASHGGRQVVEAGGQGLVGRRQPRSPPAHPLALWPLELLRHLCGAAGEASE
jgi:hypothetical protein